MKVSKIVAGLAIVPMLAFSAPVYADDGQLLGGSNVYVTKNVTQNGAYASTANVTACNDVIQFSVELSNTKFTQLNDIVVTANVPANGGTSNMTATTSAGGTTGTEGAVTVTGVTADQTLTYVNGSTKLYNGSAAFVKNLDDGITTADGLNVGDLAGSTKEFVNFQAKVNCETKPDECKPGIPKGDARCETPVAPTKPTTLVKTGPGDVAALFAVVAIAGAVAYNWVLRRQSAR